MRNSSLLRAALGVLLLTALAAQPGSGQESDEPRETGIIEQTGRRLVQLDVTVSGPDDVIAALGPEDFELAVAGKPIVEFEVDRLCSPEASGRRERDARVSVEEPQTPREVPPATPATYLFYFDQPHLNLAGRARAIEMSHELIPELVTGGSRGMVVSSGEELRAFSGMTEDPNELIAAVEQMDNDRKQWNTHALAEDQNVAAVLRVLDEGDIARATTTARRYQSEERWRTDRALRRFSMVLGRLADLDPPKAVIYFADTMRSNAGEHYLSFFGTLHREREAGLAAMELDSFSAGNVFEKVLEEAATNGIRIYSIQAEGLVSDAPTGPPRVLSGGQEALPYRRRLSDAQDSLVAIARETGGQSFLNGVKASRIVERIAADMSCLYLISFDAADLAIDQSLPVRLRALKPKVRLQVRGRVVLQSESARLTSRLLAAFTAPDVAKPSLPVHGVLIPTGYENGRYSALAQVASGGSPLSGTTWDIGLSLVAKDRVTQDASGRVSVSGPGVPVVFEVELDFKPGPYEIVAVAHEIVSDEIATRVLEGSWPDPDETSASIGPIALLQPAGGAFLRDEQLSKSGALALGPGQLARADANTALVGLVCRAKSRKSRLRLERTLVGDESSRAPFEPLDLDLGDERCAQFRDLIHPNTMTPGLFRYEVRVLDDEEELASTVFQFAVDEPHARAGTPAS